MCFREAGMEQMGYPGSSPIHWWKLTCVGRMSYVALMVKLSCLTSMAHTSVKLIFLLSTLSHCVHSLCLPSETALACLVVCSWRHTSSTTISLHSGAVAISTALTGLHLRTVVKVGAFVACYYISVFIQCHLESCFCTLKLFCETGDGRF